MALHYVYARSNTADSEDWELRFLLDFPERLTEDRVKQLLWKAKGVDYETIRIVRE